MLKKNQAMKLILLAGVLSFPVTGMAEQMPNQPKTSISQQNGKVTGTVKMPWELLSELRLLLKEQQTEQPPTLTDDSPWKE